MVLFFAACFLVFRVSECVAHWLFCHILWQIPERNACLNVLCSNATQGGATWRRWTNCLSRLSIRLKNAREWCELSICGESNSKRKFLKIEKKNQQNTGGGRVTRHFLMGHVGGDGCYCCCCFNVFRPLLNALLLLTFVLCFELKLANARELDLKFFLFEFLRFRIYTAECNLRCVNEEHVEFFS